MEEMFAQSIKEAFLSLAYVTCIFVSIGLAVRDGVSLTSLALAGGGVLFLRAFLRTGQAGSPRMARDG